MNYDYRLDVATPPLANVINLIAPDGNFFPFSKQPDGTLINTSDPAMSGAVMTVNGTDVELRWKDSTKFEFQRQLSSLGQPIEVLNATIDPNGNQTTVVRTGIQISDIFDPVGRRFHFDYDSGNHITQITDPIGRQVKYSYKSMQVAAIFVDLLEDVTDPNGGNTHYIYDNLARLVSVTDPRGVVLFTNTYDPTSGRVIKQVSAEGGGVFNFAYTFANPQAPGISPILETDVTDPLGNVTIYRFNPQGYPIQVTDPLGQTRILDRDGNNKIVSLTGNGSCDVCRNPELGDRSFTYDANGNPLTATDALGNTTRFTYDPVFNKVTSITDPLGNVTQFAYNLRGNLLSTTDPNGHTTSFAYSPFGELISIVDASGQNTTLGYDSFGNPVSVTDALGNTTSIAYDAVSRPIQTVDALGRKTTTAYDTLDRVVAQTNAQNNQTQFAYDAVANLLSVTDAKGSTTSFTYDSLNRLLMRRDPLGKSDTRTYDLNGNLTKFVDRRGQISQFIYDALDRLAGETYPDATVGRSYDANGRLIYANDSAGSAFAFTYDAMGHPTSSTSPFGSVQYTRDADGRVTSRQVAGQAALAYSYDPAGNLLSAALPQASAIFAYNARNKLTSLARANGITSQYAYDNDGRLLSITDSAGSGTLNSQTYVYDPVGNRSMHTTNIAQPLITQAVSNTYDAANRLVQSVANGTTTLYTYDANGNLTSATGSTGTTIYTWDGRNRLVTVSMPGGQTTNFQYDFRGNLITQTDTGSVLNLIQNFVLDDRTNLAYIDRSNGDSISVLAGRSIDQHLAVVHSSGQAEYGLTNAINSTTATVDQTGAPLSKSNHRRLAQRCTR